jgi:hypothetical protein
MNRTRRELLADVGRGMLIASLGPALTFDLGLANAWAADSSDRINFGDLEPLVDQLQGTPAGKLQAMLLDKLKSGTELKTLVAAGALANARQFGGQHYEGYHTFMALAPAFEMSQELPADRRALPVFKVLYRNAQWMQQQGGPAKEVLHPVKPAELARPRAGGDLLRQAMKQQDMNVAEATFAALTHDGIDGAYNDLQFIVQDATDVHRVVLAWRAWALLSLTGKEQAHTMLRQSVRYCVRSESYYKNNKRPEPVIRASLPKLLDQYKLVGRPLGTRAADDAWVEKLAMIVYGGSREQAADAVAAALAEGMAPAAVAEAISLAANRLVLCDGGRTEAVGTKSKYSVHGDSVGVHASDAANAWRNIARVSNPRNTVASLIVGAFHTAGQAGGQRKEPYPVAEQLAQVSARDAGVLLDELQAAIKNRDQAGACALTHRYGELGHAPRPLCDVLLRFAVSEDGALHAEKYYRTVAEEFATMRPAFRWRQLVALARVTASEFGQPAPGYEEACQLLKV